MNEWMDELQSIEDCISPPGQLIAQNSYNFHYPAMVTFPSGAVRDPDQQQNRMLFASETSHPSK